VNIIEKILEDNLIPDSQVARVAGLSDKTVKNLKRGLHSPRMQTKQAFLDGLNQILRERGHATVGSDIFKRR
jgi:hypothetical protein